MEIQILHITVLTRFGKGYFIDKHTIDRIHAENGTIFQTGKNNSAGDGDRIYGRASGVGGNQFGRGWVGEVNHGDSGVTVRHS